MKRPGQYSPSENGSAKHPSGARGPSFNKGNKGRQENFGGRPSSGGRDAAPRYARPERGGFERPYERSGERGDFAARGGERSGPNGRGDDRGGFGGRDRDRGNFEAGASRPRHHFDRDRGGDERGSFEGPSRRPPTRSFGNNNGQSYRREGGMGGGYGRPARDDGGFQSFTPPAAAPVAPGGRPAAEVRPVAAHKLKDGVAQANKALAGLIEQFGNTIQAEYDISQLEATVSFDREGRFIGFGEGGAVSFSLTITPLEAEDVFTQDEPAEDAHAAQGAHSSDAMMAHAHTPVHGHDASAVATLGMQATAASVAGDEDYAEAAVDNDDDGSTDADLIEATGIDLQKDRRKKDRLEDDRVLDDDDDDLATAMDATAVPPSMDATAVTPSMPEPSEAQPAKRRRSKTSKADEGAVGTKL